MRAMMSVFMKLVCKSSAGMDVARKVVILARECGLSMELQDVEIESLVPQSLQVSTSAAAFLSDLPKVLLFLVRQEVKTIPS